MNPYYVLGDALILVSISDMGAILIYALQMGECRPKELKHFTCIQQLVRDRAGVSQLVEGKVHGDSKLSSPDLMNTNTFHFAPKDNDKMILMMWSFIQKVIIRVTSSKLGNEEGGCGLPWWSNG